MRRTLTAVAAATGTVILVGVIAWAAGARTGPDAIPIAAVATPIFGINMSLYGAGDSLASDPQTQQVFRDWGVPLVRVPLRTGLDDATYVKAMQAVKAVGATPMIIMRGPQPDSLTENRRLLALVMSVFGDSMVYLEYGNEEDLDGMGAAEYTRFWNQVIPEMKSNAPAAYKWVGPVNFKYNPGYAAQFARDADPKPDYLSWHEYVCNESNDDGYCTSHIANWTRHVTEVNTAVQAATGRTFPYFISEWNLNPDDEGRYSDSGFVKGWTAQALSQLKSLPGLAGAMIYTATDHGDFGLLDGGRVTPQGEAFRDAALDSRGITPSASTSDRPSPSASPAPGTSVAPSRSPTPIRSAPGVGANPPTRPTQVTTTPHGAGPAQVRLSFESGVDGFDDYWGGDRLTIGRTTETRYHGSYSLSMNCSGSGYTAAGTRSITGLVPGQRVTFQVWFGGQGGGTVQPWVMDTGRKTHFPSAERPLSGTGWMSVSMTVPQVQPYAIGMELYCPAGGTEIRLDAVNW